MGQLTAPHATRSPPCVARQAPAVAAAGLVGERKAESEEQGEHACDKRFAMAQALHGGGFLGQSDGEGPLCAGLVSGWAPGSPAGQMGGAIAAPRGEEDCTMARSSRRASGCYHLIRWNVEKCGR